ncbi:MAG TPA: Fis family transcriptional regulator [Myxococcales bacterium]|nr:Fis family transcriptional regulator [Myxococcales bacterium]
MVTRQTESMRLKNQVAKTEVYLSGAGVLRRPINLRCLRIGRDRSNDISPQGVGLSRKHAQLRNTSKGWIVEDLGSKNGTFVAGARVERAVLPARAELRFGGVVMLFEHCQQRYAPVSTTLPGMLGSHPSVLRLTDFVRRVAPTSVPVVIRGESGVGKELIAQAIHELSGARGRLVNVNCGALNTQLVGSHLFGHVRGAFTGADRDRTGAFEAATDGTLFLDEIGEMPLDVQAQLLRTLECGTVTRLGEVKERTVSARIICATHRDLEEAVQEGRFRLDLYHRLMVFPLQVPPLRERRNDIITLATAFLQRDGGGYFLSSEAEQRLINYPWPGNVRELKNSIQRATILCAGSEIMEEHLGLAADPFGRLQPPTGREALFAAIVAQRGNLARTARCLGVSRSTIYRQLKTEGLDGLSKQALLDQAQERSSWSGPAGNIA